MRKCRRANDFNRTWTRLTGLTSLTYSDALGHQGAATAVCALYDGCQLGCCGTFDSHQLCQKVSPDTEAIAMADE